MRYRHFATFVITLALLVPMAEAQVTHSDLPLPTLTNLAQLRALPRLEAAKHYPFRGKVVVTYADLNRACFVQDETGGSYLGTSNLNLAAPLQLGDLVEIAGRTDPGGFNPVVLTTNFQLLAKNQPMPKPKSVSLKELSTGKDDGLWVETEGVVHEVTLDPGHVTLQLESEGVSIVVIITAAPDDELRKASLLYAKVRVQGVLAITSSREVPDLRVRIQSPSSALLKMTLSPQKTERPTILDLAWLRHDIMTNTAPQRVSVIAKLGEAKRSRIVILTNLAGESIEARGPFDVTSEWKMGEWTHAFGFPLLESNQVVIKDASLSWMGLTRPAANLLATNARAELKAEDFRGVLSRVLEVRGLAPNSAALGIPVCIKAVVTLADSNLWTLFIQQGDRGVFVNLTEFPPSPLAPGTGVEVRGFSANGITYPYIEQGRVTVLGPGRLPDPVAVSIPQLRSGQYDGLRVKVSGLVRSVITDTSNRCRIVIAQNGLALRLTVCNVTNLPALQAQLPGRQIEATGVCATDNTNSGPMSRAHLMLSGSDQLLAISPHPTNYFNLPLVTIEQARKLSENGTNSPVHLRGVVLGQWLDDTNKQLFISDPTGTIVTEIDAGTKLVPGTKLELAGISDRERSGLVVIRFAQWLVQGQSSPPEPTPLASFSDWTARGPGLIKVRAKLAFSRREPGGHAVQLVLSQERDLFEARLSAPPEMNLDYLRRPGSELSVTGIVMGQSGATPFLNGAILLVRSPADVVVLSSPGWWTSRRIALTAGGVLFCFLAGLTWVSALHRRVRHQTEVIRKDLEAESALEKRYQLVWESSADGMRTTDQDGIVTQVNNTYCKMVRKTRDELIGHPIYVIFPPEARSQRLATYKERFTTRGFPRSTVQEVVLWDGRKGSFETSNSFFEQPGQPVLLLSVIREVTERKRLEEELRTAQKMEAVGRLAGGVAHDFNNILTIIQGYTGLCKDDEQLPPEVREMLVEIDSSAARAATLVRQLLTFSRRQPLNIRSVDLASVVENMIQMLKRLLGADITIDFTQQPPIPRIHADTGMMEQVVMNLSVNARDAMRDGGCLAISVRGVEFSPEGAKAAPDRRPGRFVCLCVEDTGCGMDEATLARVFEPFFTTKDVGKGTGLGLSTVYGIVKQHRGWIEAASQVGQGAKFRVYLPADDTPIAESTTEFRYKNS